MNIKFQVSYSKPKKKGYSKQIATLYTIEDANFWKDLMSSQGCKDIEINPIPIL